MTDRRTMVTAFSPPDGLIGTSALMCALSADAPTVELLLSEFTGERAGQRRARGVATAVLALDGRCDRAPLRTVAGLYLAERKPDRWPEGSMLHAKVALLGFARDPLDVPERIRLVVSTGNWTKESLSQHIDMIWLDDFDVKSEDQSAIRSDVVATADFFASLLKGEHNLFQTLPPTNGDALLAVCKALAKKKQSRFFHSMTSPLISQIGKRFVPEGQPWNWIYAGSGFFEQASNSDPVVLEKIEAEFNGKTTSRPNKWIAVNADRPGAFASKTCPGWIVCEPIADEKRTFMHAKFIAAGRRLGTNHHDVTVYLGSGNLSKSGVLTSFGTGRQSRIEAGVVFSAGMIAEKALWQMLPDSSDMDPERLAALVEGPGEPEAPVIPPPPILFAQFIEAGGGGSNRLRFAKSDPECAAQVKLKDAIVDVPIGTSEIPNDVFADAYLEVRASSTDRWEAVPVLGTDGSFARVKMTPGTVIDLIEALLTFPFAAEIIDDEDELGGGIDALSPAARRPEAASSYTARDAMHIVEQVARLGADAAAGPPERVAAVARSLRRSLVEGLREVDKATFASLGIDFTAVLKEMPGLPRDDAWTRLVDEVSSDWGLAGKPELSMQTFQSDRAS